MSTKTSDKLAELLRKCTVHIASGKTGTGFFVAKGYILTCHHVVEDVEKNPINVVWYDPSPHNLKARVIGPIRNNSLDLALLQLESNVPKHPCVAFDFVEPSQDDPLLVYGYAEKTGGLEVTARYEGRRYGNLQEREYLYRFKGGIVWGGLSGSPLLSRYSDKVCAIVNASEDHPNSDNQSVAIPIEASIQVFQKYRDIKALNTKFHDENKEWRSLLGIQAGDLSTKQRVWNYVLAFFILALLPILWLVFGLFSGYAFPFNAVREMMICFSPLHASNRQDLVRANRIIRRKQAELEEEKSKDQNVEELNCSDIEYWLLIQLVKLFANSSQDSQQRITNTLQDLKIGSEEVQAKLRLELRTSKTRKSRRIQLTRSFLGTAEKLFEDQVQKAYAASLEDAIDRLHQHSQSETSSSSTLLGLAEKEVESSLITLSVADRDSLRKVRDIIKYLAAKSKVPESKPTPPDNLPEEKPGNNSSTNGKDEPADSAPVMQQNVEITKLEEELTINERQLNTQSQQITKLQQETEKVNDEINTLKGENENLREQLLLRAREIEEKDSQIRLFEQAAMAQAHLHLQAPREPLNQPGQRAVEAEAKNLISPQVYPDTSAQTNEPSVPESTSDRQTHSYL
ncbi:MAG: trypsin-like peptidase domain-containing protein [Tildeniella nuda ZEHNDER 1965/U140]|jgi:regulator of replication initiation timing|nr:trypsin-like peptidase domain-containing protein [Tildeniella nuda ZEHNDER 1965/U140]